MNRDLRLFTFNEAFAWQHLTTALCEQFGRLLLKQQL
eukprot:COSAG06_NODE_51432_length_312_cov_0.755869_1_plen_36_part_10